MKFFIISSFKRKIVTYYSLVQFYYFDNNFFDYLLQDSVQEQKQNNAICGVN